jgi:Domain of unknown function (DUF4352)
MEAEMAVDSGNEGATGRIEESEPTAAAADFGQARDLRDDELPNEAATSESEAAPQKQSRGGRTWVLIASGAVVLIAAVVGIVIATSSTHKPAKAAKSVKHDSPVSNTTSPQSEYARMSSWLSANSASLKSIGADIVAIGNESADSNTQEAAACKSLTSDASTLTAAGALPDSDLQADLKSALNDLAEGAITCQAAMASNNSTLTQSAGTQLNMGISEFATFTSKMEGLGYSFSGGSSQGSAADSTTTTTSVVNHVGNTLSSSTVSIQLQQVMDPATSDNEFESAPTGDRLVGVKVLITNPGSATLSDDANNDFSVIGSDGQTYTPSFESLSGCTNFDDGEYSLGPNASAVGCVTFDVPTGVAVSQVQFSSSLAGSQGGWDVP